MIEADESPAGLLEPTDVDAFVPVTMQARESQIAGFRGPGVFAWNDVLHL